MKAHEICIAVVVALSLDARAALPQAAEEGGGLTDRIVGMAMTRGGAHSFLQRLTDSIGGRVT